MKSMISKANKRAATKTLSIIGILIALIYSQTLTYAQTKSEGATSKLTTPGAPAGSYSLSGFENVNLFNGNLNFNLPLVKVGGRGKAQSSINLTIDSAKWEVERIENIKIEDAEFNEDTRKARGAFSGQYLDQESRDILRQASVAAARLMLQAQCKERYRWDNCPHVPGQGGCVRLVPGQIIDTGGNSCCQFDPNAEAQACPLLDFDGPANALVDEWMIDSPQFDKTTLSARGSITQLTGFTLNERSPELRAGYGPGLIIARYGYVGNDGPARAKRALTRIFFLSPDGTEYELRDELTDGRPRMTQSAFSNNRGKIFVSPDGTGLRFVADQDVTDVFRYFFSNNTSEYGYLPSGFLYFPDGTKYRVDNGTITWIRDIDGNQITYVYDANRRVTNITDSLGRQVQITYNNASSEPNTTFDSISTQLSASTWQTIKVYRTNLANALRADFQLKTYQQLFPDIEMAGTGSETYNPANVVKRIELPDGRSYQLRYNSYNELSRIVLPTGGAFEYEFPAIGGVASYSGSMTFRPVLQRRVYPDGGSKATNSPYSMVQSYGRSQSGSFTEIQTHIEVATSSGSANGQTPKFEGKTKHYFYGAPDQINHQFYPNWKEGKEFKSETYDANEILKQKSENEFENPLTVAWGDEQVSKMTRVKSTISTAYENGLALTSKTVYGYDNTSITNNKTDEWFYDFGTNGAPGRLLKHAQTLFLKVNPANNLDYTSANIYLPALPATTKLFDVSPSNVETLIAQTETRYDEAAYPTIYAGSTSGWTDPGNVPRGNATTARVWNSTDNTWLESHAQFDNFGNGRKAWDAKGNMSEVEFASALGYAFPTKTKTAVPDPSGQSGSNVPFESTTTYNFYTGAVITTTDANGQVTTAEYNDVLQRPTRVIPPVGAGQTIMEYGDTVGNLFVRVKSQIDATNWTESTEYFDGLGRKFKTQSKDTQGDVFSETVYDNLGRVKAVSNPYRAGETKQWTTTNYDPAGRPFQVIAPDGAVSQTVYGLATTGSQIGTFVQAIDPAGKTGRSITNALGQLVRVDEPDDANNLGSISAPTQPTFYQYDAAGNMVKVSQGVQNRFFKYDGLGRLIRVKQPEQGVNPNLAMADPVTGNGDWSAGFIYDANGNLISAQDTKGTIITSTYDNLNRVLTRSYSDSTPAVTYKYDNPALQYSKGKLTRVSNSVSTNQIAQFDNLGRVLSAQQITDGVPYNSSYTYNLGGALVAETYPDGSVVTNTYRLDGSLNAVIGQQNGQSKTYADSFNYNSAGAVNSMRLGNNRWENAVFNSRLQVTQLGLGTSASAQDIWKVNYDYGTPTENNGNVKSQTTTTPGLNPFVQNYTYDSLSRLKTAAETSGGVQTWSQTFSYDRYGNRTGFQQTKQGEANYNYTPSVDPNTNRFVTGQGYVYDLSGNLTMDVYNRQFFFNGDNKQTEVRNQQNQTVGQYYYDADGKRIKKVTPAETTIFVYSGGKLVMEMTASNSVQTTPVTQYLTTDTLGSPRVITDQAGNVHSRRDFMPFGEDLNNVGGRSVAAGFKLDNTRQKFTGYQKDNETGLDFAEARMYNNFHGRFTAVDPLLASGKSANPQTFNRYNYSGNNPINITDPLGLDWYQNGNRYRWSEDNKTFKDGSSIDGWTAVDFSKGGDIFFYQGCVDSECSQTKLAALFKEGGWDWYGGAAYEFRNWRQEAARAFTFKSLKKDWDFFWQDPLGPGRLGDPSIGFGIPAVGFGSSVLRTEQKAATTLFSKAETEGAEKATKELLELVGKKREVVFAKEGSDELRYLVKEGAAASVNSGAPNHILFRANPSKVTVLEEFLHGTQFRLGIFERLGRQGTELHVNRFMLRHKNMLNLTPNEVRNIEKTIEQIKKGIF